MFTFKQCGNHNSISSRISGVCKSLGGILNFVVDLHACVIQQMLKKTNSYTTGIAQARIFICCKTKTKPKQNKTKKYIVLQKTLQLPPIHPFLVLRQRTSMSSPGSLGTEHENPTTGKREGAQRHHRSVVWTLSITTSCYTKFVQCYDTVLFNFHSLMPPWHLTANA